MRSSQSPSVVRRLLPDRLLLALLCALAVVAAAPATASAVPQPFPLAEGWEFRFDHANQGFKAGWKRGDRASDWADVRVPHVFDPIPKDESFLGTIGWYRTRFATPSTPEGFTWALRFEGVRRKARVYLNGRLIGRNANPYQPFSIPADGLRTDGTPNELVVRVQNLRDPELREGWWNWGGIIRPVTLVPQGNVVWEDVGFLSDVECTPGAATCGALMRTDGVVWNRTNRPVRPLLVLRLTSPRGTLTRKTVRVNTMQPGERRRVGFPVRVQSPMLWSPKAPNLYEAYAEVMLDGQRQQVVQRNVGLRYIRVVDGRLELNGHPLQLRGASIQEDLPGRGPALRDQDVEQIVADLKALGANVTRAQYPMNERLLERFDQEGILVWSQAPVYHEDRELARRSGRGRAYRKVRGTVLYARNHPSVMTHSVANELSVWADEKRGTRRFMRRSVQIVHDLDHTVPASIDMLSYPRIPRQESYAKFDLIGINSYYGWYRGKTGTRSTARLSDLWPFLRSMKRKYPSTAQVITEFGAESTFEGPPDVKESFAFQSRYIDRTLDIVERAEWLSGAIYWTAREFYVKPNWDGGAERDVPRDALHNKGLITYEGQPKPAFHEARRRFAATPVYDE